MRGTPPRPAAAGRLLLPAVYNSPDGHLNWMGSLILGASLVALWKQINIAWLILAAGAIGAFGGIL